MGDFVKLNDGQTLPERHQKGEPIKFTTDASYVVQIRGVNLLTLRLGIFFDGTTNNSFSAEWGKGRLDNYYTIWKQLVKQEKEETQGLAISSADIDFPINKLPDYCFTYPEDEKFHFPLHKGHDQEEEKVTGSAANELTNVQKIHELYLYKHVENGKFTDRLYITGVGTGNSEKIEPADESLIGQGLGVGKYGVVAKAETAITSIADSIKSFWDLAKYESTDEFDAIEKVEFDVFGFSRGAAAARHFINLVLDGEEGVFASEFILACQQHSIPLVHRFDFSDNQSLEVTFAGLYDTVAAVTSLTSLDITPHNNDNADVRLWLDPKRVKRAVHLTAHPKTEYRYNFCLNRLNDIEGDNKAPHFEEHQLPGAHSDLGGGYVSVHQKGID